MKVYVITEEPYHDNSHIRGVAATLAVAMALDVGQRGVWETSGFYIDAWPNVVAQNLYEDPITREDIEFLIYELEVVPA